MADQTVIGLALLKINGIYHVDVKGMRWSTRRANQQHVTGGGVKQAIGVPIATGSIDEVIPRAGALDWFTLKDFSVEVVDLETKSVILASFTGCNWTGLDGSVDLGGASAGKNIAWNGTAITKA